MSDLKLHVFDIICSNVGTEDPAWRDELRKYMEEIYENGCQTGIVPQLIYTIDCVAFVKEHLVEILDLFDELIQEGYIDSMPTDVNHIAWTAFELITRQIYVYLEEECK